jgi:hypothetical protein
MTGAVVSGDGAIGDGAAGATMEVGTDADTWRGAGEEVMEGGIVLQLGCLPAGGYFPLPDATLSGAILSAFKSHLVSILIVLYPTNR